MNNGVPISETDIYRIGQNAVRLFPATSPVKPCLQPQAFRVLQLQRGHEINNETLGAVATDKYSPFFWSRLWHETGYDAGKIGFNYPLVTMYELNGSTRQSPFLRGYHELYAMEITVLDQYLHECTDGLKTGCESRSVNQIFIDTGIILRSVLQFFAGSVVATVDGDTDGRKWHYKPNLEALKTAGTITGYTEHYAMINDLAANNKEVPFLRVEAFADVNVFGTKCRVAFDTNHCETVAFNNALPDFSALAFRPGAGC